MPGAPALCATAALRSGAGLVKIATERDTLPTALAIEPCATGIVMEHSVGERMAALRAAGPSAVWAVGPGWGQSPDRVEWVRALLAEGRKLVLDADGLNALARSARPIPRVPNPHDIVLTPHPGEFKRLAQSIGITHPLEPAISTDALHALATQHHHCTIVLKGHRTTVSNAKDNDYTNSTGSVALATPGSGDVLTGILAALIAQGMPAFDAAKLATYLHGRAGERWHRKHGPTGLTARLLLQQLAPVFEEHRRRDLDDIPF